MLHQSLRWAARALSIVSFLFIVPFAFSGGEVPTLFEFVALAFFPVGMLAGFAIAWWKEGLGGGIALCSVAAFLGFLAFKDGAPRDPTWFLVLASPGALFIAAALTARAPVAQQRA